MEFKKNEKYLIRDSILGEVIVSITEVTKGGIVQFENPIIKFSGQVHESIFTQVIIQKLSI